MDRTRKWRTRAVWLVLIVATVGLLGACSGSGNNDAASSSAAGSSAPAGSAATNSGKAAGSEEPTSASTPAPLEPVTLKVMLWGDKPNQMDEILAEFEARTKDTLNTKLDITWTPIADYPNKLDLKMAAGEEMDLVFDAPWIRLNQFVDQGNYHELDSYFHNDRYPGLKKAFPDSLLNNNLFKGHVYGVPLTQYYGSLAAVFYRKDLADRYGITSINTLAELENYYETIKQNEPNLIPFIMRGDGTYDAAAIYTGEKGDGIEQAKAGIWVIPLAPNLNAGAYIKDGKAIAVKVPGDSPEGIRDFPAPYNETDYSVYEFVRGWRGKGYIEKEPIVRKDSLSEFTAGKAASYMDTLSQYISTSQALKGAVPDGELGVFIVDVNARNFKGPSMTTDFRAWNFLSVPKSSPKLERAMLFLNWLFADQANHDLFEFGIEGKNWSADGDSKYGYPEGLDVGTNYNLPGYQLTWNPAYIRIPTGVPDEVVAWTKMQGETDAYLKSAVAGFVYNAEPMKTQLANPDLAKVYNEELIFRFGMIDNPVEGFGKQQEKWANNKKMQGDIQAVKADLLAQLQAYLDANPQ